MTEPYIDKVTLGQEGAEGGDEESLEVEHRHAPDGEPRGPDNTYQVIRTGPEGWSFNTVAELLQALARASVPVHDDVMSAALRCHPYATAEKLVEFSAVGAGSSTGTYMDAVNQGSEGEV